MAFENIKQTENESELASADRRVITHLFSEYERVRAERDAAETRLRRFEETIHHFLSSILQPEQGELAGKFEELKSGTPQRGGPVFGNVISLFKTEPKKTWTVIDVMSALAKKGQDADSKSVSNAIGYLAKTGRLLRVGRGQYVAIDFGVGVEIEGFEQGTNRSTEHDF